MSKQPPPHLLQAQEALALLSFELSDALALEDYKGHRTTDHPLQLNIRSGYFQLTGNSEKTLKWLFPVNWK